jgi:hypothetical protein
MYELPGTVDILNALTLELEKPLQFVLLLVYRSVFCSISSHRLPYKS